MQEINPMVSVVVLTYNQEGTVSQTIDSILGQETSYSYEIIIGEDASTDDTRKICEQYQQKHQNIVRLMPKAPNKGVLINYRDCLAQCRGKYIMECAGDDWWHNSNKMQKQVDILETHDEYVLVYSDYLTLYENGSKKYRKVGDAKENIFEQLLNVDFTIYPLTVCFRSSLIQYVNFDDFISHGFMLEDYPTWLTFAQYGKFYYLNGDTATYRYLKDSISHNSEVEKMEKYCKSKLDIQLYFLGFYGEDNITEGMLYDKFWRRMFSTAFLSKNKEKFIGYYKKLQNKHLKDYVKYLMAQSDILWTITLRIAKMLYPNMFSIYS